MSLDSTFVVGIFVIIFGAMGVTAQTSINARLKLAVGSPFASSFISFVIGFAVLLVLTMSAKGHAIPLSLAVAQPWWIWLGGIFGVVFLTLNILLIPRLGAIQTAVFPMAGQVIMSPIIDHFGLFDAPRQQVTAVKLLGVGLVLLGAVGVVYANLVAARSGQRAGYGRTAAQQKMPANISLNLWRAAGFIAGMLSAAQTAVNGRLGQILGSALPAAVVNFGVGVLSLLVVNIILRTWRRLPAKNAFHGPWWMWLGGVLGAIFVSLNAYYAPLIGAGTTVLAGLSGMTIGSVFLDHFGLLGNRKRPVIPLHLILLVVLVLGVVLVRTPELLGSIGAMAGE